MMGCYVGEVLVRQAGVEWVVEEEMKEVFGSPILLPAGDIQVSPITRCYRRLKSDSDGVEVSGPDNAGTCVGQLPSGGDREDKRREDRLAKPGLLTATARLVRCIQWLGELPVQSGLLCWRFRLFFLAARTCSRLIVAVM